MSVDKRSDAYQDLRQVAEAVCEACILAALEAYENAKVSGLCEEGAWEVAVGAMREVDLDQILEEPSTRRRCQRTGSGR